MYFPLVILGAIGVVLAASAAFAPTTPVNTVLRHTSSGSGGYKEDVVT